MATITKTIPPEKLHKEVGDRGSYSMEYDELFATPSNTLIRLYEEKTKAVHEVKAGVWKEYGVVERGQRTHVLLPVEYFTNTTHV